jgi:WD40 repeat protein
MKDFKESDKTEKAQPAPTGTQGRQVSSAVLTEALADFAPHRKITHRTGTHLNQYHGVAISPDGSKMLTANRDRTARLWDIATGQCLMVFTGHADELRRAAFLHDGTRAVTTADDGTLRVWDLATGACSLVLAGHTGIVTAVAVSPDDRYVLSGGNDGTVRIWSIATGFPEHVIEAAGTDLAKILVPGDGASFIVLSHGNTIRRWSLPDLRGPFPVAEGRFPNPLKDIALTGDGKVVAAAWDGLYWFDMLTGVRERVLSFESRQPYKVAVTPDGERLVACCHYGVILVVNHKTGVVEKELTGHRDDVTGMAIAADGKTLCTVSLDWTCRIWNIDEGHCTRILNVARNLLDLSLSGSEDALAAHDAGGTAKVWNLASGAVRVVIPRDTSALAFLDLPGLIAAGLKNGKVLLLRRRGVTEEPARILEAHKSPVDRLVPLKSGAFLASCAYDAVKLWDVEKGECLRTVSIPGRPAALAVDDDVERIAVSCVLNGDIFIFNLQSGARTGRLKGHTWPKISTYVSIRGLHFNSRGSTLISSGRDGRVILWDLATFSILQSVEDTDSDIFSMAVENDEHHVLVGTVKGSLECWDLASGRREVLWPGVGQPLLSIVLSPDGRRIFASLSDGTVRIIDRQSGILLCSLWNVDDGFFWFTPPDKHAPEGWIWTDRDDLVHVVEESAEGKVLGAVPLADDRRRTYVRTRNNAAMVRARLQSLDEYERLAGGYTRALTAKQRETAIRPIPLLPKGGENA